MSVYAPTWGNYRRGYKKACAERRNRHNRKVHYYCIGNDGPLFLYNFWLKRLDKCYDVMRKWNECVIFYCILKVCMRWHHEEILLSIVRIFTIVSPFFIPYGLSFLHKFSMKGVIDFWSKGIVAVVYWSCYLQEVHSPQFISIFWKYKMEKISLKNFFSYFVEFIESCCHRNNIKSWNWRSCK